MMVLKAYKYSNLYYKKKSAGNITDENLMFGVIHFKLSLGRPLHRPKSFDNTVF
jgi:hypothetical protein